MSVPIVHLAAAPDKDRVQRCLICGHVLTDNRPIVASIMGRTEFTWWPEGQEVTVSASWMVAGAHPSARRCSEVS